MPAIHLFQRKTLLGGDDLQIPALITLLARLFQFFFLLVPIWVHIVRDKAGRSWEEYLLWDPSSAASCRHSHYFVLLLVSYSLSSTLFCVVSGWVELRINHWSSQGTPVQRQPRTKHIESLLEFKLLPMTVALLLIAMTGVAALSFASVYLKCTGEDVQQGEVELYLEGRGRTFYLWWFSWGILLLSQVMEILLAFLFWRALYYPNRAATGGSGTYPQHHELLEEMWADRCSRFCQFLGMSTCFLFGGRDLAMGDYGDVARALADYLETRGVLDVVPSDIVAGFLVLQRLQRRQIYEQRRSVISQKDGGFQDFLRPTHSLMESGDEPASNASTPIVPNVPSHDSDDFMNGSDSLYVPLGSPDVRRPQHRQATLSPPGMSLATCSSEILHPNKDDDMRVIKEGARFAKYALAIYTWVLYLYENPISGIPRLLAPKKCCVPDDDEDGAAQPGSFPVVVGDNCCHTHKKALLLTAGLENEADLVYAQLQSSFRDVPYCILLDHSWKSVVLAIRGTFSLEDCVTDVLIDPEPLEGLGNEFGFDAKDQHCHGGVLACVRNVYRDLQQHQILERLLLGPNALYSDYTLRLVGHSLGAATSTLLSYMLRPTFPNLRCLNYSPPGCTLTWEMATTGCRDWCTSFVLDSDIVPRLSVDSMENLRNEILDIIGRLKVPKIEVTQKVVMSAGSAAGSWCCSNNRRSCHSCCHERDYEEDRVALRECLREILYDRSEVPVSDYQQQLEQFLSIQHERRQARGNLRSIKLYPPGKLVHLVKTGEEKSCWHGVAKVLTCCTTNAGFSYTPTWIPNDGLKEIVVSPTMGTDHFPNRLCFELEVIAMEFGLDPGSLPNTTAKCASFD